MTKQNLAGLDEAGLSAAIAHLNPRPFVPRQIYRWLYGRRQSGFATMTDLSQELRGALDRSCAIAYPETIERLAAADGTERFVYQLAAGGRVESVRIPGEDGQLTLCLSSQVGCPLACTFCVSGLEGVKRNLETAEILGQARAMLELPVEPRRVNIVFMGMGEALLNFDNVARAIAILSDPDGFAIAHKRMTVSTAGHVPAIGRFAGLPRRPRLAVSLNATTDEQRSAIMPINRSWNIAALLAACRAFPLTRGERITFEYVMLAGINDSLDDARRLPRLLAGIPAKVNLIPWNQAPDLPFTASAPEVVDRFAEYLHDKQLLTTVRRRRGADADAACGQLALSRADRPADPVPPDSAGLLSLGG